MFARSSCKAIVHRAVCLAAFAAPLVAVVPRAEGAPERDPVYRLEVELGPGAEECPSALVLAEVMRGGLRRTTVDGLGALPAEGHVWVEMLREGSSWRVRFRARSREGYPFEREDAVFEAERCEEIVPKVASMVARMIEVPQMPSEEPPLPEKRETVSIPAPLPRWNLRAGLGAEIGHGMLPQPKPGLRFELGGQRGIASFLVDLRLMMPSEVNVGGGRRFVSQTFGLVGGGCLQWRVLGGCALLTVGWLYAEGRNFKRTMKANVSYIGMGMRVFVELPLPMSMALRFEGDFVPTLAGVRVVANAGEDVLWTMPPFMSSGAMKLVHTFR
ncbi:hypothetical protein [Polyangium aurulentum]|uniref:hypothetical protein n=1 Tax=Polyangium aurulentum TaxID=2567896 RepID=UPI0010ADD1C3|nr:hypothetical protein [Polyangium aurulentum]UQA60067.1 hypothetical protein E8A73_006155 [Polyangium aurulentum]